MLPILQIGPLAIPLAPFSLLFALWLGLSLAEKTSQKHGVTADVLNNLVFTGLIAGILGARIGYILQYPQAFAQSPFSIISLNPGLLDPWSGFIGASLGLIIYGNRARLSLPGTLDALTPLLATLGIGMALSHIASGEAYGAATSLPWGIELWGLKRHPAQFYELAASVTVLLIFLRAGYPPAQNGTLFLKFAAVSAGSRLFLEAFRGDSAITVGGIRTAQVIAWVILAASLIILEYLKTGKTPGERPSNG